MKMFLMPWFLQETAMDSTIISKPLYRVVRNLT